MGLFGIAYATSQWRLYIDGSERSLKVVLLNNGTQYASLPVRHSVYLVDSYKPFSYNS